MACRMALVLALGLFMLDIVHTTHILGRSPWLREAEIQGFNWSQIEPLPGLRWYTCYESYECARLQVPLDWSNRSNTNTVAIALTRVPAVVSYDDPTFGGSILINPGGPGGSGVDEVIWGGYGMRDNIIDSGDKHFEIIGFDPRGVHHTTPSVSCFGSDWDRSVWQYRNWAVGPLDSSDNALNVKWAFYQSLANLCAQSGIGRFEDGTNMRQFVSTALTAKDMVAIIDALQEERAAKRAGSGPAAGQQRLAESSTTALLNFWGFSYGTHLGNTFASMFPHRIGRMILDGNVDPIDYTATGWLSNLFDNNKNLQWFYYTCFHAGPKCAFFAKGTSSLFDLEKKMALLLDDLRDDPVPVIHDGAADLVTYADMANLIHGAAYAPLFFWQDVAQVAHDLSHRNGTSIVKYLKKLQIPQGPDPTNPEPPIARTDHGTLFKLKNDSLPYPPDYPADLEGAISILCGDGEPINGLTKTDWKARLSQLKNQSAIAGPIWATIPFACQHWPSSVRPFEYNRFTGPFKSKLADYDKRGSPLLFIGSTADPVTPLRNTISNSKHHEGSRVLIQDTPGHCSGPVNPSQCTFEAIRRFFANGTLPEEGTVCMGDRNAWDAA